MESKDVLLLFYLIVFLRRSFYSDPCHVLMYLGMHQNNPWYISRDVSTRTTTHLRLCYDVVTHASYQHYPNIQALTTSSMANQKKHKNRAMVEINPDDLAILLDQGVLTTDSLGRVHGIGGIIHQCAKKFGHGEKPWPTPTTIHRPVKSVSRFTTTVHEEKITHHHYALVNNALVIWGARRKTSKRWISSGTVGDIHRQTEAEDELGVVEMPGNRPRSQCHTGCNPKPTEEELTVFQTCRKCGRNLSLSHFYRSGNSHEIQCILCRNGVASVKTPVKTPITKYTTKLPKVLGTKAGHDVKTRCCGCHAIIKTDIRYPSRPVGVYQIDCHRCGMPMIVGLAWWRLMALPSTQRNAKNAAVSLHMLLIFRCTIVEPNEWLCIPYLWKWMKCRSSDMPGIFDCNQCGRKFGTSYDLVQHLKSGCTPMPEMYETSPMDDNAACLRCKEKYPNAQPCLVLGLGFCPYKVKWW